MESTASQFSLQGAGPFLHWLTLAILIATPILASVILYKIGGLPGALARKRNHPQAEAIGICGWMGLITIVLWPLAMVWAHVVPGRMAGDGAADPPAGAAEADAVATLREATARLADVERRLSRSGG